MAQYLLAVYHDDGARVVGDGSASDDAMGAFTQSLIDAGQFRVARTLQRPTTAVRVGPDGRLGDGPLHPGHVQLAGFWIIEARTRTEAQAIAVRGAAACGHPLELRPLEESTAADDS